MIFFNAISLYSVVYISWYGVSTMMYYMSMLYLNLKELLPYFPQLIRWAIEAIMALLCSILGADSFFEGGFLWDAEEILSKMGALFKNYMAPKGGNPDLDICNARGTHQNGETVFLLLECNTHHKKKDMKKVINSGTSEVISLSKSCTSLHFFICVNDTWHLWISAELFVVWQFMYVVN